MRKMNEAERNQIKYLRQYKASLVDRLIGACEAVNEEIADILQIIDKYKAESEVSDADSN